MKIQLGKVSDGSKTASVSACAALASYIGLGLYFFLSSLPSKAFSEALFVRDLMALDVWSLLFFALVVLLWLLPVARRLKVRLILTGFSVYGIVAVGLCFDGTPFSYNAYWGDQAFRQAILTKFLVSWWPTDFYYKNLPVFYPPVYFYLLSWFGRLFSVEAFGLLKIGNLLVYLAGPVLLFAMWRRLVSRLQALLITVATFLICSLGESMPVCYPHAFLGNAFFIPWWLYYVEQVKASHRTRWFYIGGGILGGIIFMTYPYAFFIGGLLILLKSVLLFRRDRVFVGSQNIPAAWAVLGCAALASSPYWLPALISILIYGGKAADQEWFHAGRTGFKFLFTEFSVAGLVYLGGLFYAARRWQTALNRGLLSLAAATVLFYILGTILGALDRPINVFKAARFLIPLAGPFVGLAAAGLIRHAGFARTRKYAVPVVLSVVLLLFLNDVNQFARNGMVKKARVQKISPRYLDAQMISGREGAVFLASDAILPSFYPMCVFISINQHYSHPASRFMQRHHLLSLLQGVRDPRLFNLVLRHNVFDPVDYLMLDRKEGRYELTVGLSNYPNGSVYRALKYDTVITSDTTCFVPEYGGRLFRVMDTPPVSASFRPNPYEDSLSYMLRLRMLSAMLDTTGHRLMDDYVKGGWGGWTQVNCSVESAHFGDRIQLTDCAIMNDTDSTYFVFAYRAKGEVSEAYKIFLHIFGEDGQRQNYDFSPQRGTDTWQKEDIIICRRAVGRLPTDFSFATGFFAGSRQLGGAFGWRKQP